MLRQNEELQAENSKLSLLKTLNRHREEEQRLSGCEIGSLKLDEEGRNPALLEGMINGNTLVLYFSETGCDMCLEAQLAALNKWRDSINSNIILFLYATNNRYVQIQQSKLAYPIYRVFKKLTSDDMPLYFMIEKETMRINSPFFPLKELPDQTEKYLGYIKEKYFYVFCENKNK
jgi:hypothetical protein